MVLLRNISQNLIKYSINNLGTRRNISKNAVGGLSLVQQIVETPDGKAFVSWHPNTDFPYELSRPIPMEENRSSSLVLKEEAINTAMQAFKNKHPELARQELMRVTHTTKHRWFPRARDKKANKDTPMDREFL